MYNSDYKVYKKSSKMVKVGFIAYKEFEIFEKITCINSINFKEGTIEYNYKGEELVGNIKDFIFKRFIGLFDKKGTKIYEGDIVKYDDGEESYIGIVKNDLFYFYVDGVVPNDSFDLLDVSDTSDGTAELTVIGNEIEDKTLLKSIVERHINAI